MAEIIGKSVSRNAKPVILTFYDHLQEYPYTAKFYVREDASEQECMELVEAVCVLTECVLGKYTIGYKKFFIPHSDRAIQEMRPGVMGTFKWAIKYRIAPGFRLKTHTIPGRDNALSLSARISIGKTGKNPDPEHPLWRQFLKVFKQVCVSEEGQPIPEHVELSIMSSNWPPKGWKKKHR